MRERLKRADDHVFRRVIEERHDSVGLRLSMRILAQTAQMRQQLATRTMPLGNLTHMTDDERAQVIAWIDRGAPH